MVINPGAFTHYSWAIHDALDLTGLPAGYGTGHGFEFIVDGLPPGTHQLCITAQGTPGVGPELEVACRSVRHVTDGLLFADVAETSPFHDPIARLAGLGIIGGDGIGPEVVAEGLKVVAAAGVVLLGLLTMISRRNAITQVIGFLSLENGLILAAVAVRGMPLVVEISVAFSILAAFVVFGVFFFRIRERFDTLGVHRLGPVEQDAQRRQVEGLVAAAQRSGGRHTVGADEYRMPGARRDQHRLNGERDGKHVFDELAEAMRVDRRGDIAIGADEFRAVVGVVGEFGVGAVWRDLALPRQRR